MEAKTKRVSKGRIAREAKAKIVDPFLASIKEQVDKIKEAGKKVQVTKNRRERRVNIQDKHAVRRRIQRAQRLTTIMGEAEEIKKKYKVNYKKHPRWIAIEDEMKKLLGRKGETNLTPAKKKR